MEIIKTLVMIFLHKCAHTYHCSFTCGEKLPDAEKKLNRKLIE